MQIIGQIFAVPFHEQAVREDHDVLLRASLSIVVEV